MTACCQNEKEPAHLVNVAKRDSLNGLVLEDFTNDTTVSTSDYKDILRVGVRCERQMRDHLLIPGMRAFVTALTRTRPSRCTE